MLRLAPRVAVALITCLLGVSAASLGHRGAGSSRDPEAAPVVRREAHPAFTNEIAEQEIRELLRRYDIAQTQHDASFFEWVESDDFVLTLSDGRTMTRAEDVAAMMASTGDVTYTTDDVQVQFHGNVAVVSGRMTAIYTDNHNSYSQRWRWVDLFVKRDGRWRIISTTQVD
jgi:ketosteroid isomerase-like protein